MEYLDGLIAGMQSEQDRDFERSDKISLKRLCEQVVANAAKNCVWVKFTLHGDVAGQKLTHKAGRQSFSRVDVSAEPTMMIPATLFRDLLVKQSDKMDYPYRLKDVMDYLQANRSKRVLGARLERVSQVPDMFEQQRVVMLPLIPFFVSSGINPLEFYPEEIHNWRYINL